MGGFLGRRAWRRGRPWGLPLLAAPLPLLLLLLWQGLSQEGVLNPLFFPPPTEVLRSFGELALSGELGQHVRDTTVRILVGFLLGGAPGVLLGLMMGLYRPVRAAFMPTVAALYPLPRIALLPLALVIFGLGEESKLFMIAFSVFFIVALSAMAGVQNMDPIYMDVARSFGAGRLKSYLSVVLPGALPLIFTGAKLALGFALIVIVGTEMIGPGPADHGIGILIWRSYLILDLQTVYVGLVATALLGWALTVALDLLERLAMPWRAPAPAPSLGEEVGMAWLRRQMALWWRAIRPFSLTASVVPVLVGSVMAAQERFDAGLFLLALFGSVAIQIGTNLANDYYDWVQGVDEPGSPGGSQVIQMGLLSPRGVLAATVAAFALGSAMGLAIAWQVGWPILAIGVASVLAGLFYTAAPLKLGYRALGEAEVFLFMGPVMVVAAYYVQARHWAWEPALVSLPVGFLVAGILHANNLQDIEEDRAKGKRTLATVLGYRLASYEYLILVFGSYLALAALVAAGIAPWPVLLALVTLPGAWAQARRVLAGGDGGSLNLLLKGTAVLHAQFGLLLALGLGVALWLD